MTMNPMQRRILRNQVVAERAKVRKRWPAMPAAEVDRRARLRAAFPRGMRAKLAAKVGIARNSLKMVVQGHRRVSFQTAVRMCAEFPDLLCLADLINLPDEGISEVVNLHREELPAYDPPRRSAA